jgi:hypothetical protein
MPQTKRLANAPNEKKAEQKKEASNESLPTDDVARET